MIQIRQAFLAVSSWFLLLLGPGLALAGTLQVDQGDPGCVTGAGQPDPYTTVYCALEDAVADAVAEDLILIAPGTYSPAGGRLVLDKELTLQSTSPLLKPLILTNHAGWSTCAIQIAADGVVLDGLEIDNSAAGSLTGYIVGDYDVPRDDWTVRNCDIHDGRNCIRPVGDGVTIEDCDLHETESDLINAEYGECYGLTVTGNRLHSHHTDLGGKPAGLTYTCSSSSPGSWADVEISYNYCWACRTLVDFQGDGGLAPANQILVAHNTVDWWIGDLPDPPQAADLAQQMSIAWWAGSGQWNGPNFDIRDNLFTRQKWYAVVDTDSLLQGQITLTSNLFWQWYLVDAYYPAYAYPNEWPGARGAVGWDEMGPGNEFTLTGCLTGDPLYLGVGTTPELYYALAGASSPAYQTASDGTNIGAWQGSFEPLPTPTPTVPPPVPSTGPVGLGLLAALLGLALLRRRRP